MDLNLLLQKLPNWMVQSTSDPRVFRITTSSWNPSRALQAEDSRNDFVRALQRELPFLLLWIESGNAQAILKDVGILAATRGGAEFWYLSEKASIEQLLQELFEGEWGLFFFAQRPAQTPPPPVPLVPEEQPSAINLLGSTGAQAAIMSDTDDVDWFVCCEN